MKKQVTLLCALLLCCTLAANAQSNNPPRPFSPYRVLNGVVYVSGQLGISRTTGKLVDSTFEAEVATTMDNIKSILSEASADLSSVVSVTVYLKDMATYAEFNRIYARYFTAPFPARACVAVRELALNGKVEISVIAAQQKR